MGYDSHRHSLLGLKRTRKIFSLGNGFMSEGKPGLENNTYDVMLLFSIIFKTTSE